jgi:hypothetical protein
VRARTAALVVALLLVSGCGSDSSNRARASSTTAVPAVTAAPAADASSPARTPSGGAPASADSSSAGASASANPSTASTNGGGSGTPALDGKVGVGQFAPALLRPDRSSRVVVEVRSQAGASLRQASLDHLKNVLAQVSGKPVALQGGPAVAGGARDWTADDLRAEADAPGTLPQGAGDGTSAVVHLLVVHGSLGGDTSVLGVSVRGDVTAIFIDQVEASGSVVTGSAGIESAVVTHEAGHLLGLVDLYLHTGRQDPDHPGHSTNKGSVMYWAVESSLVGDLLTGGPPQDFDQADLADLASIRGA